MRRCGDVSPPRRTVPPYVRGEPGQVRQAAYVPTTKSRRRRTERLRSGLRTERCLRGFSPYETWAPRAQCRKGCHSRSRRPALGVTALTVAAAGCGPSGPCMRRAGRGRRAVGGDPRMQSKPSESALPHRARARRRLLWRRMSDPITAPESAEREVMRLYERWPARRNINGAGRSRAFFAWLRTNYRRLTEDGAFGDRDPHRHISAMTARWEGTYGRVERTGSR